MLKVAAQERWSRLRFEYLPYVFLVLLGSSLSAVVIDVTLSLVPSDINRSTRDW